MLAPPVKVCKPSQCTCRSKQQKSWCH